MCIDHRSAHITVTEKFLDRPYIVALLKQTCSERMPERMAARPLGDICGTDRFLDGPLEHRFMQGVTPVFTRLTVPEKSRCGKNPLPSPFPGGSWVFPLDGVGELDGSGPVFQVQVVLRLDALDMGEQRLSDPDEIGLFRSPAVAAGAGPFAVS